MLARDRGRRVRGMTEEFAGRMGPLQVRQGPDDHVGGFQAGHEPSWLAGRRSPLTYPVKATALSELGSCHQAETTHGRYDQGRSNGARAATSVASPRGPASRSKVMLARRASAQTCPG